MAIAYEEPPVRRSANEVSRAYQRGRDIVVPIADRDLEVRLNPNSRIGPRSIQADIGLRDNPGNISMTALQIPTAAVFRPLLEPARYKGAYGGRAQAKVTSSAS
jgi:hypothetical protein